MPPMLASPWLVAVLTLAAYRAPTVEQSADTNAVWLAEHYTKYEHRIPIKLVSSKDDAERMPSKGDPLSVAQIELLKRWIDGGAEWPEAVASTGAVARSEMVVTDEDRKHWSFLPLKSPLLPAVKRAASVRTPVDRFILARLKEKKLGLLPQADAQKLVRRI